MERALGVGGLGRELGVRAAGEFARSTVELSQAIGAGIAGGFGRALQRSTAIAALAERLSPGQGEALSGAFERAVREGIGPLTTALGRLFGSDGDFARSLGGALGGAALGSGVADVAGILGLTRNRQGAQIGGQLGGAIGNIAFGPVGGLIGGALGSIAGGLIRGRNPFADARLSTSAAGANASIFNQRGDGSSSQGLSIAGAVTSQLSQIAGALGAEIRAGLNLGAIGFSGNQFYFNRTGGDFKAAGNQRFGTAEAAVAAAVANALATGAITSSPRVTAALQRYAGNVNQAVAEALKVRDLEQLLEAQGNPFAQAFRDFERQARQRIDVARQHGFDVIQIERLNADQRASLIRDTLDRSTGSARALLDEFRFGDRAGGSVRDRLTTLGSERDRLAGLVRGGDGGSLDALAEVIRQIDDLNREAFGATGEAANGRAASAALLQELIDATEARVRAASEDARRAQADQVGALRSMDATLEDIFRQGQQSLAALQTIAGSFAPAGGGLYDFPLAQAASREAAR